MDCLLEASKLMQIVIFTASHQTYADAILDYLDPDNTLFSFRMYRQHCIQTPEGYYVKDLRVIKNVELKDMVLVDNSVYSFSYQIDNGIPIISYYDDPEDEELLHLMYYVRCLSDCEDVRVNNRKAFQLYKIGEGGEGTDTSIEQNEEEFKQNFEEQEDLLSDDALSELLQ